MDKLKQQIFTGKFAQALKFIQTLNVNEQERILTKLAFDTTSISIYTLVVALLLETETAQRHAVAEKILSLPLDFIEGAAIAALYHIRRAIELDPDDMELKQVLLTFHESPNRLVIKKEAIEVAKAILKNKPYSKIALRILSDYGVEP